MNTHAASFAPAPATGARAALRAVVATRADALAPLLRVTLGAVMAPHGAQKLLGWFGGYGWSGTMGFFTQKVGLPTPVAAFVILLESIGSLLLIAGVATRPVALGFIGLMIGAVIAGGHIHNGFFMNWFANQPGEGVEYHLLVVGIALALVVRGGGSWSVDRALTRG